MNFKWVTLTSLCLALAACNGAAPRNSITEIPDSTRGATFDTDREFALRVVDLTNRFRAKHGLRPLVLNQKLSYAAQLFAQAMGTRDFFSHRSPDGKTPGKRIAELGYRWTTCGENIALGQPSAEQVVQSWINTPAHRSNILNPQFQEMGVGYFVGISSMYGDQTAYWVQNFGARS